MRGRKKQIRTPNGGRHPTSDFRGRRRAEKSERSREEHTHPSHFASKHISTARIRAQMCLCIFAFGSLREGYTFFLVRALFFPLSLSASFSHAYVSSLSFPEGEKKTKKSLNSAHRYWRNQTWFARSRSSKSNTKSSWFYSECAYRPFKMSRVSINVKELSREKAVRSIKMPDFSCAE